MTVVESTKDTERLTLTIVTELAAPPERVWALFSDARQLERWWGPPGYPATFTRHEFVVGGESRYHMTGPDGEMPHGYWQIERLDPPRRLGFKNGLGGPDGEPAPDIAPMQCEISLEDGAPGTRMAVVSRFSSLAQMEQFLAMGMEEGMGLAISQIDELLARSVV